MFFDVANIDAPSLMARTRFEWVGLWLVWLFWGWLDSIELTILGHDASTCSWRHGNAKLLKGGIHSPLPK